MAGAIIIGAGGQARELASYLKVVGEFELRGFVVTDLGSLGPNDSREFVVGDYGWIGEHLDEIEHFFVGIGTPAARLKVAADIAEAFPGLSSPALVHPRATVDPGVASIGEGALVCPNVVVSVGVDIAPFALLNYGATVGHESKIGRGCVVNPGANVSGGVVVGDGALVGAGAVILQYRCVGSRAVVGAGAVVTQDVAAGLTVVGVPARPLNRGEH